MSEQIQGFSRRAGQVRVIDPAKVQQNLPILNNSTINKNFVDALSIVASQIELDIEIAAGEHFPNFFSGTQPKDLHRKIIIHPFSVPKSVEVLRYPTAPKKIKFAGEDFELNGAQRDSIEIKPSSFPGSYFIGTDAGSDDVKIAVFEKHRIFFLVDLFDCRGEGWDKVAGETDEVFKERFLKLSEQSCQLIINVIASICNHMMQNNMLLDYEEHEKKIFEQIYDNYKKLYPAISKSRLKSQLTKVADLERSIGDYEATLNGFYNELQEGRKMLNYLQSSFTEDGVVGNREMFSNLLEKYYESIDINTSGEIIEAVTRDIYVKYIPEDDDRPHVYLIGKIKVTLPVNANTPIKMYNTKPIPDNAGSSFHHPHLRSGDPCFGNLRESVAKLRSEGSIMVLLQVIAQFLFSYNRESPYNRIEIFPDVTESFDESFLVYDNSKKKSQTQNGEEISEILRRA